MLNILRTSYGHLTDILRTPSIHSITYPRGSGLRSAAGTVNTHRAPFFRVIWALDGQNRIGTIRMQASHLGCRRRNPCQYIGNNLVELHALYRSQVLLASSCSATFLCLPVSCTSIPPPRVRVTNLQEWKENSDNAKKQNPSAEEQMMP